MQRIRPGIAVQRTFWLAAHQNRARPVLDLWVCKARNSRSSALFLFVGSLQTLHCRTLPLHREAGQRAQIGHSECLSRFPYTDADRSFASTLFSLCSRPSCFCGKTFLANIAADQGLRFCDDNVGRRQAQVFQRAECVGYCYALHRPCSFSRISLSLRQGESALRGCPLGSATRNRGYA